MPGWSPGRQRIFRIFYGHRTLLVEIKIQFIRRKSNHFKNCLCTVLICKYCQKRLTVNMISLRLLTVPKIKLKGKLLLLYRPEKWYGILHSEPYHLKKWYGFGRVCRIGSHASEHVPISCTVAEIGLVRYWLKIAFNPPHLYLAHPLGVIPSEFRRHFWHQKTRVDKVAGREDLLRPSRRYITLD